MLKDKTMFVDQETNSNASSDALVVLAYDSTPPSGPALNLSSQSTQYLLDLQARGELSLKTGKVTTLYSVPVCLARS